MRGMHRIVIVGTYCGRVYLLHAASGLVLSRVSAGDAVKGGAYIDPASNFMYFGSHDGKLRQADLCNLALYSAPGEGGEGGVEVVAMGGGEGHGGWEGAIYSSPTPIDTFFTADGAACSALSAQDYGAEDGEGEARERKKKMRRGEERATRSQPHKHVGEREGLGKERGWGWKRREETVTGRGRLVVCTTKGYVACVEMQVGNQSINQCPSLPLFCLPRPLSL